jgi:hypothetical protein
LDLRAPYIPLDQVKRGVEELKCLRRFWLGDYYPLTDITLDERAWTGWEFYRPDLKAGFPVFLRQALSQQQALETGLRGVDPAASYDVTFVKDYEVTERRGMTGKQLAQVHVEIDSRPGSLLIKYGQADVRRK